MSENKAQWNKSRSNFLLPVKALSVIFRAKFRDELKKENHALFNSIPSKIWRKGWVVNSIPVGRGEKALKYLAQYVFHIAISNNRIIACKNGTVTFKYKESQTNQLKIMKIDTHEFIRRFLQHVLPIGFVKVRYYGLFASVNRARLYMARMLFGCDDILPKKKTSNAKYFKCAVCKKEMVVVMVMPRHARERNKAPPKINNSSNNLIFDRCA